MNLTIEEVAQVAHEINQAYCLALGDTSIPSWEDAPTWQKESAIDGVRFHLEHPEATPVASHEQWLRFKENEGWVWGPEKNPTLKQHPCIVPYNQLPVEQKAKDYLFRQVVHSLARGIF